MKHELLDTPDFGVLRITFDAPGEKVVAESGAMVAMGPEIDMHTQLRGGLLAAAKRKVLGGESLFQNTFTAKTGQQELYLAPPMEGDLRALELAPGQTFFLQSGAYVAHVGDQLVLDAKWGGVKGFFSGVGFFLLKITGPGMVYYASYGAIHEVHVDSEGYSCDTDHIVGFTEGLDYRIRTFGGFKGLLFSGEGLICDFNGDGSLYVQTRSAPSLASFLHPFRPVRRDGN